MLFTLLSLRVRAAKFNVEDVFQLRLEFNLLGGLLLARGAISINEKAVLSFYPRQQIAGFAIAWEYG